MVAYAIEYKVRGKYQSKQVNIDAKDVSSAKKKIGRKHGYKDGRMISIERCSIIGYY